MSAPLYLKIKNLIKEDIISGKLKVNDILPSENDLALKFKVSRITSKRALNDLELEGYIIRKKGLGSFVSNQNPSANHSHAQDILFIMPFPNEPSFGNYTQGILTAFENKNFNLHIQQNKQNLDIDYLRQYAGVIFYPIENKDMMDFVATLYGLDIPLVLIDKDLSGTPVSSVLSNNFQGGYEASKHLLTNGSKKIRFLSSQPVDLVSSIRERYFGFLKALKEEKINSEVKLINIKQEDNIQAVVRDFYENGVDGLVCENDLMAIQVMNAIKDCGYTIPDDFQITGFDNTQASQFLSPTLTTIKQNFTEIGRVAGQHLINLIDKKGTPARRHIIDTALIVRESSKKKEQ